MSRRGLLPMMIKSPLFLFSISAFLASCGGIVVPNSNKTSENSTKESTSASISDSSTFSIDSSISSATSSKTSEGSSEESFVSSAEESASSSKEKPGEPITIIIPTSSSSSESKEESSSQSSSSRPSSTSSSSEEPSIKEIAEKDALDALTIAYTHDVEVSQISLYDFSMPDNKSYTYHDSTASLYMDGTLHIEGVIKQNDFVKPLVSPYIEEKSYEDGELFVIRKYESIFLNRSSMTKLSEDEAKVALSLGQAASAYATIASLKKKQNLYFYGYQEEDGSIYGSYSFVDDSDYIDQFGNIYCIGVEFSVSPSGYLTDFFYAEGQFEYAYWNEYPSSLRRHGPQGESFFYEATDFVYGEKASKTASFPKKDNLVSFIDWKQGEVTLSSSDYPEGYIFLPELVVGNVTGFEGAPLNNLIFSSSGSAGHIADKQYLMISGKGDIEVSATDSLTEVESKEPLLIHIV